ncbi:hypothetical protein [Paenimyroides baculatum]|uniref:Uncharacterized protein n=1 Tax=Paenimyroides baculatum TaxID=2608000 RepID=A0A5M6C9S4_9FLAO|nr:hypothetical protein [Paenimyroides baculatum]KAA5531711.1 hypothetical protein F0460_15390 [Paenimyroides baculatum]
MKTIKLLTAILLAITSGTVQAQDDDQDAHTIGITIPTVLLVDIEPSAAKNITMDFTAPAEAGNPITPPTDNANLWLNYSYIPSASGETARVDVKIDALVAGLDINLSAAADAGNGGGTKGLSAGTITLTSTDQSIITAIGASYTNTGANNGHNLTYSLDVDSGTSNYANLFADTNNVTVTYTIVEN